MLVELLDELVTLLKLNTVRKFFQIIEICSQEEKCWESKCINNGKFNPIIELYCVWMTMLGNNFLRCDDKIYSISINDEIVIDVSFEKGTRGFPFATTETVNMINKNDFS